MKASSWIWVVMVAIGFGSPSCGGKSGVGSGKGAGGQGGDAGEGGSGAGPATHVSECESLCARTADAGCTTDATSCLLLCATVTGHSGCQSAITNWLDCAGDAEVTCDESDNPTFNGCDEELVMVSACAISTDPPKVVARSCSDYCGAVDDAGCTLDSPLGDCDQACGATGMVVSVCQGEFVSLLNCQSKTSITCDENGNPEFVGCESQQLLYMGCVMTEVGEGTLASGGASGQ